MKAAVVESFDRPPRFGDFPEPVPQDGEVLVSVRAAALSQLVRVQASGKHYVRVQPPFVPGADGVGLLQDGRRVYFAFPRPPVGAMAERVAVKASNIVLLPDDIDDVTAAAIANPGMSSWAALRERSAFKPGDSVLVNGATGASGRLAIQIAKHLGARRVVATSRNPASEPELRALGADSFVLLSQPQEDLIANFRKEIANGIDIVLDYVWGPSAEALLAAATGHSVGGQAAPAIRFINMGALGGATISLPAGVLRSSGIELVGSGLGSLSNEALMRSIASMMQVVTAIPLKVDAEAVPLTDVESAWNRDTKSRIVFTL